MWNKTGRHNKNYQKRMFTKADWPGFRRVLIGEVLAHVRGLLSQLAPCEFLLQIFSAVTLFSRFSEFRNLQNSDWNLITIFGTLIRYNEEKTGLYFWCNFYTFFPPVKYYKPTHTIIHSSEQVTQEKPILQFFQPRLAVKYVRRDSDTVHDLRERSRTVSVCHVANLSRTWTVKCLVTSRAQVKFWASRLTSLNLFAVGLQGLGSEPSMQGLGSEPSIIRV